MKIVIGILAEYTKIIYYKTFNEEFDNEYIIKKELLGSGSIGQACKVKNKKTNDYEI